MIRLTPSSSSPTKPAELAAKLRERIAALEWDHSVSDRVMRIQYLETVLNELEAGNYSVADAWEALEAGAAEHFHRTPSDDQDGPEQAFEFPLNTLLSEYAAYAEAVARGTLTDTTTAGAAVLGGVRGEARIVCLAPFGLVVTPPLDPPPHRQRDTPGPSAARSLPMPLRRLLKMTVRVSSVKRAMQP